LIRFSSATANTILVQFGKYDDFQPDNSTIQKASFVMNILRHPNYNRASYANDLAIIVFPPVTLNGKMNIIADLQDFTNIF
jgi:hypothetical protein